MAGANSPIQRPVDDRGSQLGHARPTTTLQWYARWLPSEDKRLVDALDSLNAGKLVAKW